MGHPVTLVFKKMFIKLDLLNYKTQILVKIDRI